MSDVQVPRQRKMNTGKIFTTILFLILIVSVSGLGYLYYQTRQELKFLASPAGQEQLSQKEVEQVVNALGKLALLPEEEPVVATIVDVAALSSQSAFYKRAENGDKLVVFSEAQQAFIYSPGRNKIVNVGPLLIDDAPVGDNANGTTEQVSAETVSVEVRNGSAAAGRGTQLSQEIASTIDDVEISAVTSAAKTDYASVVVVNRGGNTSLATAQQIAAKYGVQVQSSLPEGEATSTADIIVIAAQ